MFRSFPHRRAGHCGSGALRDLFEWHGLDYGDGPLSEGALFALSGALGFLFLPTPELVPPVYAVGRTADLERDIAAHAGLGLDLRATDDPAEGWRWVRDEIDAGRPPMVWADIAELEYLRVRMANTRHDIVIAGYDEEEGVAFVADNDRDDLQRCSLASLAAARNSHAFPGPNRHTTYVYRWPQRLRDPRAAIGDAAASVVRNMADGGGPLAGLSGARGLAGIDALAADYASWPQRFGDELPGVLKGLWVFIVKAGTGGAMFRSLQAEGLHDFAALLGDGALARAAAAYDELAAAWVALGEACAAADHASGTPLLRDVQRLEREGVAALSSFASRTP